MRTQYFVLAAALSVPSAFAAPAQTSALSKRDEKTWDSKGNIKLTCTLPRPTTIQHD